MGNINLFNDELNPEFTKRCQCQKCIAKCLCYQEISAGSAICKLLRSWMGGDKDVIWH